MVQIIITIDRFGDAIFGADLAADGRGFCADVRLQRCGDGVGQRLGRQLAVGMGRGPAPSLWTRRAHIG